MLRGGLVTLRKCSAAFRSAVSSSIDIFVLVALGAFVMHGNFRGKLEKIDRPIGFETDQMVADVLKDVAEALWPKNTAASLAASIIGPDGKHPAVRTIERYFEGKRDWSGDAIAAIVAEILSRHKMRNVRIRPR